MTFIFRNKTIFWDISKWNRGQKKWDRGSTQEDSQYKRFLLGGVSIFFRDVVRTYVFFSFLLLEIHCSYIVIENLVLMLIYIYDEVVIIVLSRIFICVVSFFHDFKIILCFMTWVSMVICCFHPLNFDLKNNIFFLVYYSLRLTFFVIYSILRCLKILSNF